MNVHKIQSHIIACYHLKDIKSIQETHAELLAQRNKMDRWFNKYIDMFDEKLSEASAKDPVRVLYDKKYSEYSDLNRVIHIAESYLKGKHV